MLRGSLAPSRSPGLSGPNLCLDLHRARERLDRSNLSRQRQPLARSAAACLAQPDRAGRVRCQDQRRADECLCDGRVRGWAGGYDWGCGVGVVAAGFKLNKVNGFERISTEKIKQKL